MVNKLVDGIVRAISAAFGDAYEIYTEPVTQNLTRPVFWWRRYSRSMSTISGGNIGKRYPSASITFPKGRMRRRSAMRCLTI